MTTVLQQVSDDLAATAWSERPGDVGHCKRARGALAHADWWHPRALYADGRGYVPRVFWWAAGARG